MKLHSRIGHAVVKTLHLEEIVIKISGKKDLFTKLIPLHSSYKENTIRTVVRNKTNFTLDISDYMQWYIWANLEDLSWKKASLQQKGVIFDVGANVGAFTLQLANNSNKLEIHSFEPNPYVFKKLKENLSINEELNNKITLKKIGLSDKKGKLSFYWNKSNSGGGSFLNSSIEDIKESIQVDTIDSYVKDNNIKNISFIKIDVEGYEPNVIFGALNTIKDMKPNLYIEVSPNWWRKSGHSIKDVLAIFEKNSYTFYSILDENKISRTSLFEIENMKNQFNLYLESK